MKNKTIVRIMSVFALISLAACLILSIGFSPKANYPLVVTQKQQKNIENQVKNEKYVKKSSSAMKEDVISSRTEEEKRESKKTTPIDINTASAEQLMQAKGIGEVKAKRIRNYIQNNGPLTKRDQLLEVDGIGEATLQNLKQLFFVP